MPKVDRLFSLLLTIFDLLLDALRFIRLSLQPRCTLAAENLFLLGVPRSNARPAPERPATTEIATMKVSEGLTPCGLRDSINPMVNRTEIEQIGGARNRQPVGSDFLHQL